MEYNCDQILKRAEKDKMKRNLLSFHCTFLEVRERSESNNRFVVLIFLFIQLSKSNILPCGFTYSDEKAGV
jgi:hypothetical protein